MDKVGLAKLLGLDSEFTEVFSSPEGEGDDCSFTINDKYFTVYATSETDAWERAADKVISDLLTLSTAHYKTSGLYD